MDINGVASRPGHLHNKKPMWVAHHPGQYIPLGTQQHQGQSANVAAPSKQQPIDDL